MVASLTSPLARFPRKPALLAWRLVRNNDGSLKTDTQAVVPQFESELLGRNGNQQESNTANQHPEAEWRGYDNKRKQYAQKAQ
jgi:hypothetical protein